MEIIELPENLANQIAAGEVVERPASVVKELLENAIDAGSTQIDIELEEAGLKKIQVIDNGKGIASDDVANAFKRHATSKIHTQNELFRIRTLGFRGEALPSIASVAKVTLETATAEAAAGSRIELSGGKITEQTAAPLRSGTKIIVEELFFNTPARLKYVKSLTTELSHIVDIINRLALSHPEIAFRLVHDGHLMTRTTGNGELKQTLAGIYGVAAAKKMAAVHGEDLDFIVDGWISLPELTRASRNYLSIIVNGRYIRNYPLTKAILAGYGSKLMVGRYPMAVIRVQMDPLLVDVNVHPTKQEVRLSKEKELMTLLTKLVREALQPLRLIPEAQPPKSEETLFSEMLSEQTENASPAANDQSAKGKLDFDPQSGQFFVSEKWASESQPADQWKTPREPSTDQQARELPDSDNVQEIPEARRFPELEFFGQMHGTYLFAQSEDGLYIVDQHAAQERIKYEYFRKAIAEQNTQQQTLLVPIVLEYPGNDMLKLRTQEEVLKSIGLELEPFGSNSLILRHHPAWFPSGEEEETARALIDILLDTGQVDVAKFREKTAIMMSCKRSIKANHHLDDAQARQLLRDLEQCENPFNCPHGRPVLIHFGNQEIEKMFKRIQDPH
ncbi:DNA mismatch repair endonuclease MutL [Enterococcus hirae]|nr:DNA mismatch repair endonuclease MutL [Enterococcus hirae]